MKNFILFGLLVGLTACAGTEADLERARYLLGKGGIANATKAATILEPLVEPGGSSGMERLEAFRLYAGAQMAAAGYDSTSIIAAMMYSDEGKLLRSIRNAQGDVDSTTSRTKLDDAASKLATIVAEDYFVDSADARTKEGLYFQMGLVDFLRGLRVFLNISGLGGEGTFDVEACKTAFGTTIGNLTNPDSPDYGLARIQDSESTLKADARANLDPQNTLVKNIRTLSEELEAAINSAQEICDYLEQQQ